MEEWNEMKNKLKQLNLSNKMSIIFLLILMFLFSTTLTANVEAATPNIIRHEGYSRENVAEDVARTHFKESNKVIIVNRGKFPDAISATNISQGRYPVLYAHEGHLTKETIELIQSMPLNEIYILGGELSINQSVVTQLENETGITVTRIAGRSRYDANVSAVRTNFNQKNHVVIASGEVYSDALYGVSYANTIDSPVILSKTNRLEDSTEELLKELNVNHATIIGGPLTVNHDVEEQLSQLNISHNRIAGRNRYIGSAEVALASYSNPQNVIVASGEVFSDALVSAPLAQKLNAPILLVKSNQMEDIVKNYFTQFQDTISNIYVQGGSLTIKPSLLDSLFQQEPEEQMDKVDINFDMELFNQEVLTLINEERARVGVESLDYEPAMQRGADIRTEDSISVETLYADHARPDGSEWHTAFNYLNGRSVFASGENLAYNWITYNEYEELAKTAGALEKRMAQMFFNQYVDSPGHYKNMIRETYNGMAVSTMFANHDNSDYYLRVYNTMVFSYSY